MKLLSGFSCCQDILATQRLSDGLESSSRQWVSGIDPANYEIFGIAYPIAFTRFCMPIICHSTNSKTDFKQLSVNNSSSTLTQLVVQEKNKQEAGIYAIIIGY